MKIGIDARFLTHPQKGGFKTYSENLVTALAGLEPKHSYILYLDRKPDETTQLPQKSNFEYRVVPGELPYLGMPWREQVGLPLQVKRDGVDILHSPCLTAPIRGLPCASVVTIHDMIWFFPEKFSQGNSTPIQRKPLEWYYRKIPEQAARSARAIITVSEASKDSIHESLRLPAERIFVTYEAAGSQFKQIDDPQQMKSLNEKYELPSQFILAIGSADPRKNISVLVEAYALMPDSIRQRYQLIIVWTHQLLAQEIIAQVERLGLVGQVKFVSHVSTEDLALFYNRCSLFVFPSLFEGFGLPPLEAMSCGAPVIAARNSSLPEILGDAAIFFDTKNIRDLVDKITLILQDCYDKNSLVQKGFKQASRFSWEKCARETENVYDKASLW
jgi:glycosyltransferase involved in cell wall biosynthesis